MKRRTFIEVINNNLISTDYWDEEKYQNPLYSFWQNWFEISGDGQPAVEFYFIDFLTTWLSEKLSERFFPDRDRYTREYGNYSNWYFEWRLDIESDSLFTLLGNTSLTEANENLDPTKAHALYLYKNIRVMYILKQIIGEDNFREALRRSIERYKFDKFDLNRFKLVAEEVYGESLDGFFSSYIDGTAFPGFSLLSYESYKIKGGKKGIIYQTKAKIKNNENTDGFINFIIRFAGGDKSKFVKIPAGKIVEIGMVTNSEPKRIRCDLTYARNRDDFDISLSLDEKVRKDEPWEGVNVLDRFELGQVEFIVDDLNDNFVVSKEFKSKYLRPKGSEGGWKIYYDDDAYGEYVRTYYRKEAKDSGDNAVWEFEVPRTGNYEILTYMPKGNVWKARWMERRASNRFFYGIQNGTLSEEIDLDFRLSEDGWNSLGVFYLKQDDDLKVVLKDKGNGRLFADAVKLVLQQ